MASVLIRNVSGMVANVGIDVGIVSSAYCIQQLFKFPVSVAAILNLVVHQRRKMSDYVDSVISWSQIWRLELKSRR